MFYCLHFVIVCVCFNFKIFCCLIRLPKQDEDYMGGNHLDLLVGFPNNHQVVSGVTLSNFWIHSWENFGKIMYVLYYFNGLCYWVWSINCIFCPFVVFLCTTSIIPYTGGTTLLALGVKNWRPYHIMSHMILSISGPSHHMTANREYVNHRVQVGCCM